MTTAEKVHRNDLNGDWRANGENTAEQNANARAYILSIRDDHIKPESLPDVGNWWQCCNIIKASLDHNPTRIEIVIKDLYGSYKGLKELLADDWGKDSLQGDISPIVPPLSSECKANEEGAELASPILDALIAFFKLWCTRSYDGYHEAVAIWVLATIAARRIVLKWRKGYWTNFYIMLVSVSGRHAKSEAASYGADLIRDCGLGYLLAPDEITPQQLLSRMSGKKVPRNYSCMNEKEKENLRLKLAFSAQKGWVYDEFGDFLQEIMQSKGYSNLFYRLLKQFYDNKPELTYDTITRPEEKIEMPSLSIIGTTAPESLAGVAGRESKVWTDGAFARISFIVPPPESMELKSAPMGDATVPDDIKAKLKAWDGRLRRPRCEIIDLEEREDQLEQAQGKDYKKKNLNGETYRIDRDPLPQTDIYWSDSIHKAHELYYETLVQIGRDYNLDARLNSNYIRLPDMALKMSMLFASVEGHEYIEMKHWARGQQIAERWRANLHELLAQLSSGESGYGEIENEVLDAIAKLGKMANSREISRQGRLLRKIGTPKVREVCIELASAKVIDQTGQGKDAFFGPKGCAQ